jgi:hypothetical protein
VGGILDGLKHALSLTNISLVAFRERSAQHWNSSGGEFGRPMAGKACVPLNTDDDIFGWRDRGFMLAAQQKGYQVPVANPSTGIIKNATVALGENQELEIFVLPFANFSANFHYMHAAECTHYCTTPWNPLWRSLRMSMEMKFGS